LSDSLSIEKIQIDRSQNKNKIKKTPENSDLQKEFLEKRF